MMGNTHYGIWNDDVNHDNYKNNLIKIITLNQIFRTIVIVIVMIITTIVIITIRIVMMMMMMMIIIIIKINVID